MSIVHTEKMAIYNFRTFFKLFLRNLQNDAYCISKQPPPIPFCNGKMLKNAIGSIMIFGKANKIHARYTQIHFAVYTTQNIPASKKE